MQAAKSIDPNSYEVAWQPHPGPQWRFSAAREFEVMYGGAAGGGKLLSLDTPLVTPVGWTTMGSVCEGDMLFDDTGTPCTVTSVYSVDLTPKMLRLTFDDGATVDACIDHKWLTYSAAELSALTRRVPQWREKRRSTRPSRVNGMKSAHFTESITERNRENPTRCLDVPTGTVRTTKEIYESLYTEAWRRNHAIPVASALDLPEKSLPLDPYVLGAWLGDGTSASGVITGVDEQIFDEIRKAGFEVTDHACVKSHGIIGLVSVLRELKVLGNKHIPSDYLRSSRSQRLALLQGLMDTDGTVARNSGAAEFTNTNPAIIDGVYEIIVSLGWKVRIRESRARLYGRDCGPKWTLKWMPSSPVFRLQRKSALQRIAMRRTTTFRYIISAEPIVSVPGRCISVNSPSGLYLAGKAMIPTHNTDALLMEATRYCWHPGYKAIIFRKTFPQLREIIDRTFMYYPLLGGVYRATEHRWYFPSGSSIMVGHMADERSHYNYLGDEFQFIGFDEAGQFPPIQYLYMFSRCRSTYPEVVPRFRSATNPGGVGHQFLKDRFQIGNTAPETTIVDLDTGLTRKFIPAKIADNPTLTLNDPNYIKRLMLLPELERMRLLEGVWDAFEGQVFTEFNPEIHGLEPFDLPHNWEYFRAFDWGYSNPWACGWFGVDFDGRMYLIRLLYGAKKDQNGQIKGVRMSDVEIARAILDEERKLGVKVRAGPADPHIWDKRPQKDGVKGPSCSEEMGREGVYWLKADNERIPGKRQFHLRLRLDEDGKPGFYAFTKGCEDFWRTIPMLRESAKNPEDVDTEQEDHIYDLVRYALMYKPVRPRVKPLADVGSFQAERRKYIKARQYAVTHGTSLSDAYGRMR